MKKVKITLVAMAIMTSTFVYSQVSIGLKGGLSITDAQAELYIDAINEAPQSFTSFLVGITSEVDIHSNLSFQPELLYIKRGFNIKEGTTFDLGGIDIPIGAKATTNINYLEVPLLAKVKYGNKKTKAYGIIGPSIGYATSARIQPKATFILDFNLPTIDINLNDEIYNRTQLSGIIGAGLERNIQNGKLFVDARYNHSFTNMIKDPVVDISVRNSGFQFSAGYAYQF
jgi:hypothetical protein